MVRKFNFTPFAIEALEHGKIADPETPGLAIEVLGSGKKRWRYRRRVFGRTQILCQTFGLFPAITIAAARELARALNAEIEAGIDPREVKQEESRRTTMTVARAHDLYMEAVRAGRASRARKRNRPRTIADKKKVFDRDIAPKLGNRIIYDVTERDLIKLVEDKGKVAKIRANRLAAELKVFFGWAASLRGLDIGLEVDPSRRLSDLKFPEESGSRMLSAQEIEWFLKGVAMEPRDFQRGMLIWLLTATRFSEVVFASSDEVVNDVWTIPPERSKNSLPHRIALGPWGQRLMQSDGKWIFKAERSNGPRQFGWYRARNRVWKRMEEMAGHPLERFTPHDLRRTVRSNTKRLKVDYETAEAMLNHVKKGLARTYDVYALEEEKRAWFALWENEVLDIARQANIADQLDAP